MATGVVSGVWRNSAPSKMAASSHSWGDMVPSSGPTSLANRLRWWISMLQSAKRVGGGVGLMCDRVCRFSSFWLPVSTPGVLAESIDPHIPLSVLPASLLCVHLWFSVSVESFTVCCLGFAPNQGSAALRGTALAPKAGFACCVSDRMNKTFVFNCDSLVKWPQKGLVPLHGALCRKSPGSGVWQACLLFQTWCSEGDLQ
jgi:hypothetical protein